MSATLISGSLQTERLGNGKRRLLRDLVVEVDGERITVPADFVTDYSSIPRALLIVVLVAVAVSFQFGPVFFLTLLLIPRFPRVDIAGVVHDYGYQQGGSKWYWDRTWRELAMAGEHRAWAIQAWSNWFVGLVLFGWFSWWSHRRQKRHA